MENLLKKHAEKIRFLIIGGINTVLDFVLLFFFVGLGVDKIIANYFSTGVTMIISFFANKSYTFKNNSPATKKQFGLFIVVTASGLWALQPLIIWLVSTSLHDSIANQSILLFIAKLIATVASLLWNYLFYSRLVFNRR